MSSKNQEAKIEIDGMQIHYKSRGSGPTVLLLLHGAVGSYNDFGLQLDEEHALDERKFTVIAPDLPGYGRSELISKELKPCEPTLDYFELCANVCAKLMEQLKFNTYSIGGWSDGARVAALMAIRWQSRCNSLVLWGFAPKMDKESCMATARARDTSIWNPKVLNNYSSVYGEQVFSEMWKKYVDFVVKTLELPEQFDISSRLSQIKCPTLVVHGSEDPIIDWTTHVKPIEMQIYDSQVKQLPGLAHNLHQADPACFNHLIGQFVAASASA